jgi:hypothetical protein
MPIEAPDFPQPAAGPVALNGFSDGATGDYSQSERGIWGLAEPEYHGSGWPGFPLGIGLLEIFIGSQALMSPQSQIRFTLNRRLGYVCW